MFKGKILSSEENRGGIDEESWWIWVEGKRFAKQDQGHEEEGKFFRDSFGCVLGLSLLVSVCIMYLRSVIWCWWFASQ